MYARTTLPKRWSFAPLDGATKCTYLTRFSMSQPMGDRDLNVCQRVITCSSLMHADANYEHEVSIDACDCCRERSDQDSFVMLCA